MAFQKPYCAVTEHSNHILRDDLVSVINIYGVGGKVDKQFVDINSFVDCISRNCSIPGQLRWSRLTYRHGRLQIPKDNEN